MFNLNFIELLLCINVILNIIFEIKISTLETKIGNSMMLYAFLILINQCLSIVGYYINTSLANKKTIEFKSIYLEKYSLLDNYSKEKDTLESFENKLDRSASVIKGKYSWGIGVCTSMISCLFSLSYVFIENNEIYLLICFIIFNSFWMKFFMLHAIDYLDKKRTEERKSRHIIEEKIRLLMNRFYLGDSNFDVILKQDIILFDGLFKLDIIWVYLTVFQQIPNLVFIILISLMYSNENKLQILLVIFMKIRYTLSSTSDFLNQLRTMENDLKAIEDFFVDKTFCTKSDQIDIPDELSFTANIVVGNVTISSGWIKVRKGSRIVLYGLSGCGKTTLIKGLLGQIEGIKYNTEKPSDSYFSKIAYMRQNIREVTPMVKVTIRNLFSDDIDTNLIKKVLGYAKLLNWFETRMNGNLDIPIGKLCIPSGGEKTRICFALTLFHLEKNHCKWLILDEPEQGLDPELAPDMLQCAFDKYPNVTIIMITHLCDCRIKMLNITHKWNIDSGLLTSTLFSRNSNSKEENTDFFDSIV